MVLAYSSVLCNSYKLVVRSTGLIRCRFNWFWFHWFLSTQFYILDPFLGYRNYQKKPQSIILCIQADRQLQGIPHFIAFCFIALHRLYFLQNEGLCQLCIRQVYWCHFSNSICSFRICRILAILLIFQVFALLLLYLLWWSVISDLWCYYCNCLVWGGGTDCAW